MFSSMSASCVASAFCLKGKNNYVEYGLSCSKVASAFCLKGKNNILE